MLQRLRTTDLLSSDPMLRWDEFANETVVRMRITPHRPAEYKGLLSRIKVGRIGLSWNETSAVTVSMDGGHVGPWSAPAGDAFLLSIQEAGTCIATLGARETIVQPGDMLLVDASSPHPWSIVSLEPTRTLTVKIPADILLSLVRDAEVFCGSKFSASVPKVALSSSMLLSIKRAIEADPDEDWEESYPEIVTNIVAGAFSGRSHEAVTSKNRPLRQRVSAIVERHLDDPDLSVSIIADELGTSVRTIQRAFIEIGTTPRKYILEQRIAAVARQLRNGDKSVNITQIALDSGFNNISYFTREFRKQMGISAREFRSGRRN